MSETRAVRQEDEPTIADREYAKYAAAAICKEFDSAGEIPFSITRLMEIIAPHIAEHARQEVAAERQRCCEIVAQFCETDDNKWRAGGILADDIRKLGGTE